MKRIFCMMIAFSAISFGYALDVKTSGNTVSISSQSQTMNVTFIEGDIVKMSIVKSLVPSDSLIVTEKLQTVIPVVTTDDNGVLIKGENLFVSVDNNLNAKFLDVNSNEILRETDRSFIDTVSNEMPAYEVEQRFKAPLGESLYGLGQYQNGIMDWKNVPVMMEQFNQEAVVPTLVSTKGYGILWDNYSPTMFNKPDIMIETAIKDQSKNISEGVFTAKIDGKYAFLVKASSGNEPRRRNKRVVLTVGDKQVINYETIWIPRYHTGTITLKAGQEYKINLENPGSDIAGEVYVCPPDYGRTQFSSTLANSIEYYFMLGQSSDGIVSSYRKLTGKAPLMPKFAYGFWQCRERYHSQEELLQNARGMRDNNLPVDVIVQDWQYWGNQGIGPVFDKDKYPDPAGMTKQLHDLNIHVIASVWPRFTYKPMEDDFIGRGWMYEGGDHYYDVFAENARLLFWTYLKAGLFDNGFDGVWSDGTEPDPQINYNGKCALGPFNMYKSAYSLMHAKTIYEQHRKDIPDRRVLNLTRSSFAGIQKYGAVVWSGDVNGDWDSFRKQITAGLNYSIAGAPYWTTDIGGFFRDRLCSYAEQYRSKEYQELLIRWFQFGAFSPVFRLHGYQSQTELWRYEPQTLQICRKYDELRYKLLPYIYSTAWKVYSEDYTFMRPLVMDFPDDNKVASITDQYMFGPSILVAPVTRARGNNDKVSVYLPKGCNWYDFWTNRKYMGGQDIMIDAPLDMLPLFVKAGSIIPMGPVVQYASQQDSLPLEMKVYAGKDCRFNLYQDDGLSYAYETGKYTTTLFTWDNTNRKLTAAEPQGEYNASPVEFKLTIIDKASNNPDEVTK